MAVCDCCMQEMGDEATESCEADLDILVLPNEEEKALLSRFDRYDPEVGLKRCHDCSVRPGGQHHPGCDTERCSICGQQAIMGCEHTYEAEGEIHDGRNARWTGIFPGTLEAIHLGLFCWENPDCKDGLPWWVPCGPDHPKAIADLNTLADYRMGSISRDAIERRKAEFS